MDECLSEGRRGRQIRQGRQGWQIRQIRQTRKRVKMILDIHFQDIIQTYIEEVWICKVRKK